MPVKIGSWQQTRPNGAQEKILCEDCGKETTKLASTTTRCRDCQRDHIKQRHAYYKSLQSRGQPYRRLTHDSRKTEQPRRKTANANATTPTTR